MIYCVEPIVCDYGVFERTYDDEGNAKDNLIVICNESDNAQLIAKILNKDTSHKIWEHRQQGEWVKHALSYSCSECKSPPPFYPNGKENLSDFCPRCGAYMKCTRASK